MGSQVPPTGYNQQVPPYAVPPQRKSNTLLIVVVVVAAVVALVGILFVLLLTPNLTRAREAANEAAAMNSLRVIYQAEVQYQSMYPASGYACALANLGGAPGSQPSPSAAQLIPPDLASGIKDGYVFNLACTARDTTANADRGTQILITAIPKAVGKTGKRGFCADADGQIKYDPSGGTNCASPIL